MFLYASAVRFTTGASSIVRRLKSFQLPLASDARSTPRLLPPCVDDKSCGLDLGMFLAASFIASFCSSDTLSSITSCPFMSPTFFGFLGLSFSGSRSQPAPPRPSASLPSGPLSPSLSALLSLLAAPFLLSSASFSLGVDAMPAISSCRSLSRSCGSPSSSPAPAPDFGSFSSPASGSPSSPPPPGICWGSPSCSSLPGIPPPCDGSSGKPLCFWPPCLPPLLLWLPLWLLPCWPSCDCSPPSPDWDSPCWPPCCPCWPCCPCCPC